MTAKEYLKKVSPDDRFGIREKLKTKGVYKIVCSLMEAYHQSKTAPVDNCALLPDEMINTNFEGIEEEHSCTAPVENECPYCDGNGHTSEHSPHPHPDGDCLGECPIQVECVTCKATGKVSDDELNFYKANNMKVEGNIKLPF